ncbi:cytochrome P450 [Balamuthia mandrillaris]
MEVPWSKLLLAALACLVALLVLQLHWQRKGFYILRYWYQLWRFRHIPHIKQLFHFGSLYANLSPRWLFPYDMNVSLRWRELFTEKNSSVIAFICNEKPQVIVNDAEIVRQLFSDSTLFPKPPELYNILRVYGDNIVSIADAGPQWKKQRALCSPAFSIANLKLVSKVVVASCHNIFKEWEAKATPKGSQWEVQVDLLHEITKTALAIISEAGFGSEAVFEPEEGTHHMLSFWNCVNNITELLWLRLGFPNIVKLVPFSKPKLAKQTFIEFEQYINEFIAERKKKQNLNEGRADLLSLLLRAEDPDSNIRLTDEEIRANIFIFLFAGHETTSHAMSFASALLALHPDVQQKVYDEVQQLLQEKKEAGDQSEDLTYDDHKKLNYTLSVFKETLRMFPPVVLLPKMAREAVEIGGYKIPKGASISIASFALHRNEKYWSEPDLFKPERFLKMSEDSGNNVNPYAYAPFSGGRRYV